MRAYVVHDGEPCESAVLVFANTAKEARRIGYPALQSLWDCEWIHVRADWIRDDEHLQAIREEDVPHVVDNPPCCVGCNLWGLRMNSDGECESCAEEAAEHAKDLSEGVGL